MKIDLDKITKEMFDKLTKRVDNHIDGYGWQFIANGKVKYLLPDGVAQQIALDAEIEKEKVRAETLKGINFHLPGCPIDVQNEYKACHLHLRQSVKRLAELERIKKQLVDLNKMKV